MRIQAAVLEGARLVVLAVALSFPGAVIAQSSASYKLNEHALNAGGHPAQAIVATSATFRITLDSVAGPIAGRGITGPSYRMTAGFGSAYAPPGEVPGLEFLADGETLQWLPEPASTAYDVYTSSLSTLPGAYGACAAPRVTGRSWIDSATLAPGGGRFYLVTGVNRLMEEGTKGRTSSGAERANPSPCP